MCLDGLANRRAHANEQVNILQRRNQVDQAIHFVLLYFFVFFFWPHTSELGLIQIDRPVPIDSSKSCAAVRVRHAGRVS